MPNCNEEEIDIHLAVYRGDIDSLKDFLKKCKNPNPIHSGFLRISSSINLSNMSLMEVAVLSGVCNSVETLLSVGAKLDEANALFIAARRDTPEMLALVLAKGTFSQDALDKALYVAAKDGNTIALSLLLKANANPKANGQEAIRGAVENGHKRATELLLNLGCDPKRDNEYLLRLAARKGHLDLLNLFISLGCNPSANDDYALRAAAAGGHAATVKRLLEVGCDPTANDSEALHSAIEKHYHEVETLLLNELHRKEKKIEINTKQSSHTASVHRSVSKSATELEQRYGRKLRPETILVIQNKIRNFVNNENAKGDAGQVAKRSIERLLDNDYTFSDPVSKIQTRTLLVYVWLAIHDDTLRKGTLEDALALFLEGLREIHRGYNFDKNDIDRGGPDKPICAAGTFNKLIEKLVGIHPDAKIDFLSKSLASLKLPVVVRESSQEYLSVLAAHTIDLKDLQKFMSLIDEVRDNGVEIIWPHIKQKVRQRMFDEFGTLFHDRNDQEFTSMIDTGLYTKIDLQQLSFQHELTSSRAYRQYMDIMLKKKPFPTKKR